MSDKVNRDVVAELDSASNVTTQYSDMSITMMMQFTRIAKWAVRNKKENGDISRYKLLIYARLNQGISNEPLCI